MSTGMSSDDAYRGDMTAVMAAVARHRGVGDGYAKLLVDAVDAPPVSQFPEILVDRVVAGVCLRTRFLDGIVSAQSIPKAPQVVVLGAGLDTRPWRLRWPEATVIWHLDQPSTVGFPSKVLGSPPGVEFHDLSTDLLSKRWVDQLLGAGFDPSVPTLFLAEAVLLYLPAGDASRVVDQASELAARGSSFGFTYLGTDNSDPGVEQLSGATSSLGGDFRSAISSPAAFLAGSGWSVSTSMTYGQYAQSLGETWSGDEGGGVSWLCHAVRS